MRSRYLWAAVADPCVLRARIRPSVDAETSRLDLSRIAHRAQQSAGCEHLRLDLPDGVLRLDLVDSSLWQGPMSIEPIIDLGRDLGAQLVTLHRLAALVSGRLTTVADQRFIRLVEALRVADALSVGASLRDIGLGIFGGPDWPGDGEHVKSRVRRRVQLAAQLVRAGPRGVLAAGSSRPSRPR